MMLFQRVYSVLICLHPRRFRQRYGEEMLRIYGDSAGQDRAGLFCDAILSVFRQHVLRGSGNRALPAIPGSQPVGPVFATVDHSRLPLLALWQGGAATVLAWFAIGFLITTGTGPRAAGLEFAGVHYLVDSRLQLPPIPVRAAAVTPSLPHVREILPDLQRGTNRAQAPSLWIKVLSLFGIKPLAEEAALAALSSREKPGRPYSLSAPRGGYPTKLRPVLVLPRVRAAAGGSAVLSS